MPSAHHCKTGGVRRENVATREANLIQRVAEKIDSKLVFVWVLFLRCISPVLLLCCIVFINTLLSVLFVLLCSFCKRYSNELFQRKSKTDVFLYEDFALLLEEARG